MSVNNNVLNFNPDNVFDMIKIAKKDIKTIHKNNNDLHKKMYEYNEYKNKCVALIHAIKDVSELYYKLSTKSQLTDVSDKLEIKQHIIDVDTSSKIEMFNKAINLKIDELQKRITINNQKISDFKTLVLTCMDDTEKETNMCNICVSRKINICLNPCGHTFCSKCADKMNTTCSMCRATVISKIKMYIVNDETIENIDDENIDQKSRPIPGFSGFETTIFFPI
jgi:hypothetical protein